jgi:hypothetical protein
VVLPEAALAVLPEAALAVLPEAEPAAPGAAQQEHRARVPRGCDADKGCRRAAQWAAVWRQAAAPVARVEAPAGEAPEAGRARREEARVAASAASAAGRRGHLRRCRGVHGGRPDLPRCAVRREAPEVELSAAGLLREAELVVPEAALAADPAEQRRGRHVLYARVHGPLRPGPRAEPLLPEAAPLLPEAEPAVRAAGRRGHRCRHHAVCAARRAGPHRCPAPCPGPVQPRGVRPSAVALRPGSKA